LAYFKDDQEVYGTIGKLFRELAADEDLAHRFWLGKVNLVPLTKPIFPRYKAMLQQRGRDNLIDV
jgi:hypothetical protein